MRSPLPLLRPRLLRLLRTDADPQHGVALSGWLRGLGTEDPDLVRIYRTFNANAAPFKDESEAHER